MLLSKSDKCPKGHLSDFIHLSASVAQEAVLCAEQKTKTIFQLNTQKPVRFTKLRELFRQGRELFTVPKLLKMIYILLEKGQYYDPNCVLRSGEQKRRNRIFEAEFLRLVPISFFILTF